jgi:hypothetical protein
MDGPGEPVRTVEVRPLSAREEGVNVIRAAAAIVFAAWVYVASSGDSVPSAADPGSPAEAGSAGTASPSAADGRSFLLPWQRLFSSLDGTGQRAFRELREGLVEAENARGTTGRWPEATELARLGVPPFAPAPGAAPGGSGSYAWTLRRSGLAVNYVGMPEAGAGGRPPDYLLLILEPDPLAPSDPTPDDETHHRLPGGKVLHVSVWTRTAGTAPRGEDPGRVFAMPQNEGWIQLLAGSSAR